MIEVYTKPACVQCDWTKRELDKRDAEYVELALEDHPEKVAEFKAAGHLSAPVVVHTVGDTTTIWAGFRPERIAALAAETKEAA